MSVVTTMTISVNRYEIKSHEKCAVTLDSMENKIILRNKKETHEEGNFKTPLIWVNIIAIVAVHILSIYGLFTFPYITHWRTFLYYLFMGIVGGFGVTAGAHRYWCHRSYKAKLPLQLILLFCYLTAGQNSIYNWVRDHRVHHKYSETDADPHNSKRGFFFAHVGWLMMKKHPEVVEKGKKLDFSDLTNDPLVTFQEKYFQSLKIFFCFILPTVLPCYLFNETMYWSAIASLTRYVLNLNFTWLVNSAAHMFGNRPYHKDIRPTENWLVSILAMGEGWHNYHHTFPWDYKAAELGRGLNLTTILLDMFAKIGWAYDLKTPSKEIVKRVIENHGDGSHLICDINEEEIKVF